MSNILTTFAAQKTLKNGLRPLNSKKAAFQSAE